MKVIHVPFCYRPDPVGGTEVYVEALAREQQRHGADVIVAAPASVTSRYVDGGLPVRRFAVSDDHRLESLYGEGDQGASVEFDAIVNDEQPDIVHLHSFTRAVSTRLARDLRKHDVGLVFTYHTPTVSCQRGTLLRWGRDLCDGTLDVRRCSACTLQSLGIERRASALLGAVPPRLGRTFGRFGLAGGAWTGLRMTDLTRRRFDAFHRFMQAMDRIVVLCRWSAELLCRNGVETDKVVISRHGLAQDDAAQTRQQPRQPRMGSDPLRVAFLGRLHPTKGVDTLVHAIRALPEAPLVLDIFGIGADAYADSLRALGSHDPRIRFRTPLATHDVIAALTNYDVVAVPSRWMETGPLVVLEAFAAGTPVVGSRLGGIAELVTDGVDGLLLDADAVLAWTEVLARLIRDVELLQRLRAGIRPPRRMDTVAAEMLGLYHDLKPAA